MNRDNPYLNWLWGLAFVGLSAGVLTLILALGEVEFPDERAAVAWLFFAGTMFLIGILSLVAALAVSATMWQPRSAVSPAGDDDATGVPADAPPWQPSFAGWYPADRGERYFDGERWTDQVR